MTSSIPDGISFGDLEAMQKQAAEREAEAKAEVETKKLHAHFDGKTKDEVVDIAADLVQEAIERVNDPMVHKIMIMMMIDNMLEWHTKAGVQQAEDDEVCSAVCWLRDAGKFQAIANILATVTTGPHDWTCGD